jgi:hypothetical protein
VPACSPSHHKRGSRTPDSSATPIVSATGNATTPISGFGKPNASACRVTITEPHDRTGLIEHVGV